MHMKGEPHHLRARDYVASLASAGRYHFSSGEARKALGVSADATKQALRRLARRQMIASPARGFYVIVPPEYRALGCLPADQLIPILMQRLDLTYYAGLLSAAQYHGAAHHRPQEFQVMLARARRPIQCGRVRAAFIVRKRLQEVAVQRVNTPRGTILVSTPEATAIDLVGYPHRVGGLDQVATILIELAERIDPTLLATAAQTAPVSWVQRLGYLLEHVGSGERAVTLNPYVDSVAHKAVALLGGASVAGAQRNARWNLLINSEVTPEL